MPGTPNNRTPVRVARGNATNIAAAVTAGDIQEGEIVYVNDENRLYVKESTGLVSTQATLPATNAVTDAAQTFTRAQRGSIRSTTFSGGAVQFDFALNNHFAITSDANITVTTPSSLSEGQSGSIFITQPSSGSTFTASWGSYWKWAGGTANTPNLTQALNAVDRIDYIVRSSSEIHAVFTGNYS